MSVTDTDQKIRGGTYPLFANSFFLIYGIWLLAILVEGFLFRNLTYSDGDPIFKWFMLLALVNFFLPYLGFGISVFGCWHQKSMLFLVVLSAIKLGIDWLCDGPYSRPWHCSIFRHFDWMFGITAIALTTRWFFARRRMGAYQPQMPESRR